MEDSMASVNATTPSSLDDDIKLCVVDTITTTRTKALPGHCRRSSSNNSSTCSLLHPDSIVLQTAETSTHAAAESKHRPSARTDDSTSTLWNEDDEEEGDSVCEEKILPLQGVAAPTTIVSIEESHSKDNATTSGNLATTALTRSPASSVSMGDLHISSRLEKYGIVQRNRSQSDDTLMTQIGTAPLAVQMAVEEVHRWLFVEGGHFEDVQALMTQYSMYVRNEFGIPIDRLYYGGVGLHPKLTAYLWRWEPNDFEHREMPQEIFERRNELFSPDEPFCVLEQGRSEFVRILDTDSYIPPDTEKWFRSGGYKDYFALPDIHRGLFKGGLAWSTKREIGFSEDDLLFFRLTHPALTTVMRLHTNDLVLKTLTERMEKEIEDRTNELAMTNSKLTQANSQISEQSAKQLEHFASMSHEIRTPLNCILGLSSLLVDSDDMSESHTESIKMIHESADLLAGVVNDVLDYAKLESGHFEIDIQPVDLQSVLDTVVFSISNKSRENAVKVRTSYSGFLPRTINTDSRRLQQILYNLLGNATKFSLNGSNVDFSVGITRTSKGSVLRMSVKDYGKGIDTSDFESIFRPFSQASKETQTLYGGTGLGLSITQKLVHNLRGTITVQSEVGKYAEFVVNLPYDGEIVDLATYRQKMKDTMIVILDEAEGVLSSYSMEDEFMTLPREVTEEAGLNVKRCSSWSDLKGKLDKGHSPCKHAFLVQPHLLPPSGINEIHDKLGEENCSWFTPGPTKSSEAGSQKSFSGILPSVLLKRIDETVNNRPASPDQKKWGQQEPLSPLSPNQHSALLSDSFIREIASPKRQVTPTAAKIASINKKASQSLKSASCVENSLKVLYAEDNIVNQKVFERILKRLGVTDITIVDNGLKAVEHCEITDYDVVFLDMQMPIMDGLEACEKIVARNPKESVIFVTAHALEDFKEKAKAAGANHFISKPFNLHKIKTIIESIGRED